jgi:hypothetical protein
MAQSPLAALAEQKRKQDEAQKAAEGKTATKPATPAKAPVKAKPLPTPPARPAVYKTKPDDAAIAEMRAREAREAARRKK